MTSNRFFFRKDKLHTSTIYLQGKEHHHLSRVARKKPKDKVWLFDEQGKNYLASVEEIKKNRTRLALIEETGKEKPKVKIILAQSLLKSKKMDLIVQKSTELGVQAIVPVATSRTIMKIKEKYQSKVQRWQKIALEAVKQSQRSIIPEISPPLNLEDFLRKKRAKENFFLSENSGRYLRDILIDSLNLDSPKKKIPSSVQILIGPEGGWSEEEENFILDHGFKAISLGNQILRAETAAISSVALISHFWNS